MKRLRQRKTKYFAQTIIGLGIALSLSSCGEESFSTKSKSDGLVTNTITTNSSSSCASFTLVKPKVDFLFLWDNSTSTTFINNDTKEALAQVVENISDRFDYHVMLAPLINNTSDTNHQANLIASNTNGLSGSAINMMIPSSSASAALNSFDDAQGSLESGISRSVKLIKDNYTNGIFRRKAYTYIVVMSNQDDNSWQVGKSQPDESDRTAYVADETKTLLCLRGNYLPSSGNCTGLNLNAIQLRFMNITSFTDNDSSCSGVSSVKRGKTYQNVSEIIYDEPYKLFP